MTQEKITGRNIRYYREINGFTQEAVAGFLGIKRELISYYESGSREIPFHLFTRLSDLFGVDMADFFEEDEARVNENAISAFRTDGFENNDLETIAWFKAIVKNYLKMNGLLAS
jgi:transcriptional regulator with XRE-family HTH domain